MYRSLEAMRLRGALRCGAVICTGAGTWEGECRAKCLQACAVSLLTGARQQRFRCVLRKACRNDDASGCVGTMREANNFAVVWRAFESEGVYFWVYESESATALACGEVSGRWCFGARGGERVGSLVWLRKEMHVMRLVWRSRAEPIAQWWSVSTDVEPWHRYVVGAPKAKGKRGSNLRRGGTGYAARLGGREGVSAGSVQGEVEVIDTMPAEGLSDACPVLGADVVSDDAQADDEHAVRPAEVRPEPGTQSSSAQPR